MTDSLVRRACRSVGLRAILVCMLVLAAGAVVVMRAGAIRAAAASGPNRCRGNQIAVVAAQLPGAAVSGGWVIRYRNSGSSACTLSGYPTVVALVGTTGP